jgi:glyoxylase-like metal-dependent hydrolase (beta-lactamase superfamily II)
MDVRVISIGAMACNELWGEREPVRTGHATTTLIQTGTTRILVDPGLPARALQARLGERANLSPADITHVFLTSFRPEVRRALELFDDAQWLISATEREAVGLPLASDLRTLAESGALSDDTDAETRALAEAIRRDVALLQRCTPAPDRIAPGIDLFPLPGATAGMTGLLIPSSRGDLLICGDAVPTAEHLAQGRAPMRCESIEAAKESLREAIEIADLVIPGRDNLAVNPARRLMMGQ